MIDKKLLRLFGKRFIVSLAVATSLALLLVRWSYLRARDTAAQQTEQTAQAEQTIVKAHRALEGLPKIETLKTQEISTFRGYADNLKSASDSVSPLSLRPLSPGPLPKYGNVAIEYVDRVNRLAGDPQIKNTYEQAEAVMAELDKLLTYHAAMMKAVANVLDYNPSVDFQRFDLADEETKQRLELAKNGLERVMAQVEEAAKLYEDPGIEEIKISIRSLQAERDLLTQTGDLERWKMRFKEEQVKTLNNRVFFWHDKSKTLVSELTSIRKELVDLSQRWAAVGR